MSTDKDATKIAKKIATKNRKVSKTEKTNRRNNTKKKIRRFNRWLTLVILLGFSGFIFYLGWLQYKIPENYGALVYTKFSYQNGLKSGGYDKELTTHDGFHWRWEKLFPTNLSMHLYPLELHSVTVDSEGTLPSGDIYLDFIEEDTNDRFDWHLSFELTYRLNKEMIPSLAEKQGILPENLDEFFIEEEGKIERELYAHLQEFTPTPSGNEELIKLQQALNTSHPYLEITSLSPEILVLPDLVLYNKARDLYFTYLDERNRALEEMISRVAPRTAVNDEKMLILEEYGKVLTEYPVLIDFFAIDEDNEFGRFTPQELMPEVLEVSE